MPLSKAHKAQSRERIIDSAAHLFRLHGYEGVGVDKIMQHAGLTRGGFYAHFPSKMALLQEVLAQRHDLIKRLSERVIPENGSVRLSGSTVFNHYLAPENFEKVGPNCTLSTLNADAARSSETSREVYTEALTRLLDEIGRGFPEDVPVSENDEILKIAALSIGALSLARVSSDETLKANLLNAARKQIESWFDLERS